MDDITIKLGALAGSPIVNTPEGRFPGSPAATPEGPFLMSPGGLYLNSRNSEARQGLKQLEQDKALDQIESRINNLLYQISTLHVPETDQMYSEKTAVSQEPFSLPATADTWASVPSTYSAEVFWPATGGVIKSGKQNPVEEVDDDYAGAYQFDLTVGSQTHSLEVVVESGDTQEDVLKRIARAIGGQDWRLSAQVVEAEEPSYQEINNAPNAGVNDLYMQLHIGATLSGAGVDFSLEDTSGSLMEDYGLTTGRPARQAYLRQGGERRMQSGNTVSLDGGHVAGTASDQTDGFANIQVDRGGDVILSELTGLINSYNDLVSTLDVNYDMVRPSLKDRITRPLENLASRMPTAGIKASAGGRMTRGSGFADLVKDNFGAVRGVFFGDNGWVAQLESKLNQIKDLGVAEFAADTSDANSLSERRTAWAVLNNLTGTVINGYF